MHERFGPWLLERRISVGDHADVSEAVGGPPGVAAQLVALKRLHPHAARDPALRALFARECQVATTLPDHPGLVRGLAVGEQDDRPWLAMPLVLGGDLRGRLDAGARPGPGRVVQLGRELCGALAALHAAGWVHGDVTPANILVDPELAGLGGDADAREPTASGLGPAHARLCDFGVARPPGEPGPVRGTHAYMAPEQVRGEPWSPATDVFALGVVLWELAAGARLFRRGAPWLTMAAVIDGVVPPLADPALDAVLRQALAPEPAARFAGPAELGAALAAA